MATSPTYAPPTTRSGSSIAIPLSGGAKWMISAVVISYLLYYFVGIDQGGVSLFGSDTHVHEFLHDARHYLGFPCH
jgi:Probable cobalt transporter subunit (CbtB)